MVKFPTCHHEQLQLDGLLPAKVIFPSESAAIFIDPFGAEKCSDSTGWALFGFEPFYDCNASPPDPKGHNIPRGKMYKVGDNWRSMFKILHLIGTCLPNAGA